jgi:hypothetical protein
VTLAFMILSLSQQNPDFGLAFLLGRVYMCINETNIVFIFSFIKVTISVILLSCIILHIMNR